MVEKAAMSRVRVDITDRNGHRLDSHLIEENRESVALWRVNEVFKIAAKRYGRECYVFNNWLTGGPCSSVMTAPADAFAYDRQETPEALVP